MCLKGMQLSLKNLVRGGGGTEEMKDNNREAAFCIQGLFQETYNILQLSLLGMLLSVITTLRIHKFGFSLSFCLCQVVFLLQLGSIQTQGAVNMSEIANRNHIFSIHSIHPRDITRKTHLTNLASVKYIVCVL